MGSGDRHVFRFFADVAGTPGARIELTEFDAHHARVLHGSQRDEPVELVDSGGIAWRAHFDGPTGAVVLDERIGELHEPRIELLAFVSVGGRVDELVDGAVQAGATRIVPIVRSERDRARIDQRGDRLARIAATAAKQAKRASVPTVQSAQLPDVLAELEPGIVLDPGADATLDEAVRASHGGSRPVRLLVGGADGYPPGLVDELAGAGWHRARLGGAVLRSELAGAIAVAIASMLAPQT